MKTEYGMNNVFNFQLGCFATGSYQCRCVLCGKTFTGDKRAVQCLECTIKAANLAAETYNAIEYLRKEEADSVNILCDNPEGDPNNAIECHGDWTHWKDERFEGDTLVECLQKAVTKRKALEK